MLQSESCIIPRAVQLESKTSRISFSAPTSNHAIMNPSAATFQQVVENELLSRCPNPHARPRYFISRGTLCVPFSNETDVSAFTKQPLSCCCGFCSPPGRSFLVPAATWVAVAFCIFLLWMLVWCGFRDVKNSHAAKTWPAEVARARGT